MSDELQGGDEETHERPRGQLPQVSDGFEELTRGNKGWWIEKMRTAFGRSPHRIAGAVRAYIESLPAGLRSEVHKECKAALVSLGRCEKCGGLAINFKVCDSEVQHEAQVQWSWYETCGTGQMDEDGKEIRRLQFVQKKTKLADLIAKLQALLPGHEPGASPNCQCKGNFLVNSAAAGQPEAWAWKKLEGCGDCAFLRPYAYHTFMALHQQRQFQTCVRDLPLGHTVFLFDFSENHSLNIPGEVQSLHWVVKQATILVCVVWRHACMAVDGVESTAENPVLVKDYVYLLSDDRKHDHRLIQYMRELIIRDYFIGRGIAKPLFIHEWADGCARDKIRARQGLQMWRTANTSGH
ncbi:hypothetical protein CYMTET_41804 [Cymbomonas tetramitiformis]|uniref:Uncharacterized protein n=1 Tax=Cymbomonas tetramitiformis TaxID=36881 RepID=A0AAE0F251_9CHLO|nr:hypothetical protein CYMTET_41804 [Cymbomonas tetramitiformis]